VEMVLTLSKNQWDEFHFKIAVANACTKLFCSSGKCTSNSKSGRVRRSQQAEYFKPSDVIVIGTSFATENTFKVEFAILFPSVAGQPPQVTSPEDVVQMVEETKEIIEKAVGGKIQAIKLKAEPPSEGIPNEEKPKEEKSTGDKGSSAAPIAAGVGVSVVVVGLFVAFVVYRFKSKLKRSPNDRQTNTMQVELDMFDNPAYNEDPIYDSISPATGRSVVRQADDVGLQERRSQEDRNTFTLDQRSDLYEDLDGERSDMRRRDDPRKPHYASLQGRRPCYAIPLKENEKSKSPVQNEENYMRLANVQKKTALDASGTSTEDIVYRKPVNGHYKIPRQSHANAPAT